MGQSSVVSSQLVGERNQEEAAHHGRKTNLLQGLVLFPEYILWSVPGFLTFRAPGIENSVSTASVPPADH
jgi:hypothetical protein